MFGAKTPGHVNKPLGCETQQQFEKEEMDRSTQEHWDRIYSSSAVQRLGWYEENPTLSLEMIARCAIDKNDSILDVGSGATTLVDFLIQQNYRSIFALDISAVAQEQLRSRLGSKRAAPVQWLIDDITKPTTVLDLKDIAIWHDRALLHFLITAEQRQAYLSVLKKVIRDEGYVIIATFAQNGASKCSGLAVKRYDQQSLAAFLGAEFALIESVEYDYQMPSGPIRPYVYGRFQKRKA